MTREEKRRDYEEYHEWNLADWDVEDWDVEDEDACPACGEYECDCNERENEDDTCPTCKRHVDACACTWRERGDNCPDCHKKYKQCRCGNPFDDERKQI